MAAVEKNTHLTGIEKITYLIGFMTDEIAATTNRLQLSNGNYSLTLNMLKDRFGDPQLLISTNMSKLLPVEPIKLNFGIEVLTGIT